MKHPKSIYKCPDCSYTGDWGTFKMKQIGTMIEFECPKCGELVCALDTITNDRFDHNGKAIK